jgi:hypothetical protein
MGMDGGQRVVALVLALILAALVAASGIARAQDLEPRAYTNTPVGMNFLVAGYGYTTGGLATDPAVPLTDTHLEVHTAVLAYARSIDVFGTSGKVDVILPYAWLSGSALYAGRPRTRDISGFADPRFRLSVNLYGAPALSLEDFLAYEQDLIVGVSLAVNPPLGQYESDKLVNIGTNRWSVKPEIGISKAFGRLILEVVPGAVIYTTNPNFIGRTRDQDPIFSVQGHVIYGLRSGIWAALDATYFRGGASTINGIETDTLQESTRLGLTVALPIDRYQSIKLYGSTSLTTRAGGGFDGAGVFYQYRWGAGL